MRILLASLALLTIAATDAPFEPRPITDAEKDVIRQAVKKKLIDPGSAQFRWNPQVLDSVTYCGFVNSKNRMGGFVGYSLYQILLTEKDRTAIFVQMGTPGSISAEVADELCAEHGYGIDPTAMNTIDD